MITKRIPQSETTRDEMAAFELFCIQNNICEESATPLAAYMLQTWQVVVTEESLAAALPVLLEAGTVRQYSPTELRYREIQAESPSRAAAFRLWFLSRQNRSLTQDGDTGLLNEIACLNELTGRDINSKTIWDAIGRLANKGQVHFLPVQATPDSRRHTDDGSGMSQTRSEKYRADGRINHSYVDPVVAAAAAAPRVTNSWERMCEVAMANYGTPPQALALHEAFDNGVAAGKQYSEIYKDINILKQSFARVQAR